MEDIMFTTRKYDNSDLEFVQAHDFILSLQIQYDGDFSADNAVTAIDEQGNIAGVAALEYQSSWYAPCEKNLLGLNICTENEQCIPALVKSMADRTEELRGQNPEKNAIMVSFVFDSEKQRLQSLLHSGFCFAHAIPVLAYDLNHGIKHYPLPDGVTIEEVGTDGVSIEEYIRATGEANDGVCDSISQYYFRMGGGGFKSFRAVCDGKTVGGVSVWDTGEDGGATENIFTVPEFRRKNIARELIATAFEELASRGKKEATLSMIGGNVNAMKLYQSIGYEFAFTIFMLKYI